MKEDLPFVAAAPVLVPMPAERPYTYAVPDGMRVVPGSIVRVPLGPRQVAGIVWDGAVEKVDAEETAADRAGLRLPADRPRRCAASSTGSRSTRCRRPAWWRACCCGRRRPSIPNPGSKGCSAPCSVPDRMTEARTRVLETAEGGLAWTRSGLAHAAGVSSTVIDGLRAQGVFETVMIPPRPVVAAPDPDYAQPAADARPGGCGRDAARRCRRRTRSASRCSTASPAPARRKSISRRWRRRSTRASRC